MKKIILMGALALFIFCISCKKQYTGVFSPIKFTPEKVTLPPSIDTLKVKSSEWIDIVYCKNYPLDSEPVIQANKTEDTLTAGWMRAVALNNKERNEYIMKVISLENNDTGKDRSYLIHVGHGPSFGSLVVTQLAE